MVKTTQTITPMGDHKFLLEVDLIDLVRAKPSRFAMVAKDVYNASGKTSDLLMWLSEEIKAIEDTESSNEKQADNITPNVPV